MIFSSKNTLTKWRKTNHGDLDKKGLNIKKCIQEVKSVDCLQYILNCLKIKRKPSQETIIKLLQSCTSLIEHV